MKHINLYSEVLQQASIIDVINYYGLKMNHNKCLCPFHNDSNPSLSVDPKRNIATCFACGTTGNVISFVQKYENQVNNNPITLNEAIAKVVDICHLNIDVSKITKNIYNNQYTVSSRKYTDEEKELLELNDRLNKIFNYNLVVLRGEALDYLHDRGIDDTSIKELSMGFIPKGQLLKIAQGNDKYPIPSLVELGYLKTNDDGSLYETFQDRIMIPICDEKGNIVTFCGRTIKDEKPKYLHTSETKIFHKKELLYNFNNSKTLAYNNELILVEGYMDVQGAKKLGFQNVAALMGVSISEEHLKLIRKNRSSITLALDNDEAGKRAMIEQIPMLLSKGFKVDVLDISKLGEYKDFGDLGNTNLQYMDIQQYKTSGFSYLLDNKYFKDSNFRVEDISSIYKELKKDKLINNTYDESLYKEYLLNRTSFSKNELNEILYPKRIEKKANVMDNFASRAMINFLYSEVKQQAEKMNDKVLSTYFENNQSEIETALVNIFNSKPDMFLDSTSKLKSDILLSNFLNDNKNYSDYESLNRFKYVDVFNKTYIKNANGSARIKLSDAQRQIVIKQFEETLSDKDKLSLEEVEELYIINSIDDIDGILSYKTNTLEILKDNIKDRMTINKGKMDFFKFGSIFFDSEKEFIDNKFKGRTGNYKTILFYNNLDNTLKLEKENVVLDNEQEIPKESIEKDNIANTNTLKKDYDISINKVLLVPELETDTHYFVRIPFTDAKEYLYIPKEECDWVASGEMFFTKLKSDEKYSIYDKNGDYLFEKSFNELKNNWEDKTKSQQSDELEKKITPVTNTPENNIIFDNSYISKYKEPICKVFKSKIYLETEKGFYIKTDNPSVLIFAIKKICNWNDDQSYLIINPRKGKFINSGMSKYLLEGYKKEFQKKLNYSEIDKYIKVFYPSENKKKNLITLEIPKDKCEFTSNFIKVPITIDNVMGYIQVNFIKSKINENSVILEFTNDELIGFHDKEGLYVNHYNSTKIRDSYNEMLVGSKIIQFPTKDLNIKELEKEAA